MRFVKKSKNQKTKKKTSCNWSFIPSCVEPDPHTYLPNCMFLNHNKWSSGPYHFYDEIQSTASMAIWSLPRFLWNKYIGWSYEIDFIPSQGFISCLFHFHLISFISILFLFHFYFIPFRFHFYLISMSFLFHIYVISTSHLFHFYFISISFLFHIYVISTSFLFHFYFIAFHSISFLFHSYPAFISLSWLLYFILVSLLAQGNIMGNF